MAKIKIVLDKRRQLSNNTYPVKLSVYIAEKGRFLIATGVSVLEDEWVKQAVVSNPRKVALNNTLKFKYNRADDVMLRLEVSGELAALSIDDIKKQVAAAIVHAANIKNDGQNLLLGEFIAKYANSADTPGTASVYNQTLAKLGRYYDLNRLKFTDVNLQWLREFEASMKRDGMSVNALSIHLRNIRAVFNRAIDEDVIELSSYPFRKFKIKTERTVKRSLTVEQLRTLRDYDCQRHQVKYRDVFMLIFYTIGINMVDLLALKEIRDGRVEFRRAKTGRLYSIKVEPEALEIIERYRGEEFLLSACDNYANYHDFLKRMNKNLQEIGPWEWVENGARDPLFVKKNKKKITPLFPGLSTYWARHTWATIAASLDIPKETIAAALGHGGNTTTDIYIDFDQRKVDAANRRVIDYVSGVMM